MTRNKLNKINNELMALRKSPHGIKPETLISIAKKLGRIKSDRGKEPTYVRELEPALSPPLSIPNHGAKDLKSGTAISIIDALLDDASDWDEHLNEIEDNENQ